MKKRPSIFYCLLMDLIGCANYFIPVFGELSDIFWAPISAFLFFKAFGGGLGIVGSILNFAEELFPGLDFIPSFTIAWMWQYYKENNQSLKN